ncbi:type VII secretion target [Mycobacterium lehmannii]|uniref:type VII secretion target n=1 Tax=Mycobacterium lehmannii TaxID=2048550 RepID=UPI000B940409|nr:type VII secretion target [Mycobacterium lehmannii]
MSDDVRVSAAHLGDLAARHDRAAADTRAMSRASDDIQAGVENTHGTIAAPTADALDAVLTSRDHAGVAAAQSSVALSDELTDAAALYGRTDEAAASELTAQMQTDQP